MVLSYGYRCNNDKLKNNTSKYYVDNIDPDLIHSFNYIDEHTNYQL